MRPLTEAFPIPLQTYRVLTTAVAPFVPVFLAGRLKRGKEHPSRLCERYGQTEMSRPAGSLIWVHCASVGELLTVVPLVGCMREKGFAVLCTSGTLTSANIAETRLPAGAIHQFVTLDIPAFVNRFFDHWQPDLGLFVESDLWPNMIMTAAQRGIPLVLLNGRLSERSFQRWRWAPHSIAKLLRCFDLCLVQSATHAGRYRELGAPRVATTGNLKLDVPEPPADADALARLKAALAQRPVIAAASTHPGEETALIEVHRRLRNSFPRLLTIIAPRHPERGGSVAEMAAEADIGVRLRSRGELPDADTAVYVVDTIGELGLVYRVAPIVFVGGSLATHGGQNPIEPAKLGAAIVHGPHVWNFAEVYAALDDAHGAAQVADVGKLAVRVGAWLTDARERAGTAAAARATVQNLSGALARTVAAIEPYLMQIRLEARPDA